MLNSVFLALFYFTNHSSVLPFICPMSSFVYHYADDEIAPQIDDALVSKGIEG